MQVVDTFVEHVADEARSDERRHERQPKLIVARRLKEDDSQRHRHARRPPEYSGGSCAGGAGRTRSLVRENTGTHLLTNERVRPGVDAVKPGMQNLAHEAP